MLLQILIFRTIVNVITNSNKFTTKLQCNQEELEEFNQDL